MVAGGEQGAFAVGPRPVEALLEARDRDASGLIDGPSVNEPGLGPERRPPGPSRAVSRHPRRARSCPPAASVSGTASFQSPPRGENDAGVILGRPRPHSASGRDLKVASVEGAGASQRDPATFPGVRAGPIAGAPGSRVAFAVGTNNWWARTSSGSDAKRKRDRRDSPGREASRGRYPGGQRRSCIRMGMGYAKTAFRYSGLLSLHVR